MALEPPLYPSTNLIYAIWWVNVGTTPYSWGYDGTAWASTWPITTDGNGNWSGWIVTKVNKTNITNNANFDWNKNIYYVARLREGTSYRDSDSVEITPLNMVSSGSGTLGGWIEGTAYIDGSPAENKVVVVKSGTTVVGIYLTENNNVNEGYSATAGYFKVGIPAGGPYTLELWDSQTNIPYIGSATETFEIGYLKAGESKKLIFKAHCSGPMDVKISVPVNGIRGYDPFGHRLIGGSS